MPSNPPREARDGSPVLPGPAPLAPRGTSPPGCARAGAGRGTSLGRGDFLGRKVSARFLLGRGLRLTYSSGLCRTTAQVGGGTPQVASALFSFYGLGPRPL